MEISFITGQAAYALATVVVLSTIYYVLQPPKGLPPGISGLRCLLEIPNDKSWLKMLEYNRKYGDIASGSLFGYNIIIIGSAKIAEDLLDKRSANYADRPRSVMSGELSGWGKIMLLSNYNDWFRTHRKWIAQEIGGYGLAKKFHGLIEHETRRYLRNLTSIILRITYGYKTVDGDDPLVDLAHVANSQLSLSTSPGVYYVDFVPLMKYLPSWLPGTGFKRKSKEYAAVIHDLVEIPYNWVKAELAAGTALPSLAARLLSGGDPSEEHEDSVKWASATLYQGGADTANSVAYGFYLAMTLYPHVMKKAQAELDVVVGTERLPTFADRPSLPYLEALFTELLRWHCPAPMTMRCTRVDDTYEGHFIPAGSYVLVNIWAILRDERTYTDPLEFKPERFLGENPETDPRNACFGFGRRRCPGYFLGHSSVWLMCAQALAVFDISKGNYLVRLVFVGYASIFSHHDGLGSHQAPFKCSIKPRSPKAVALLQQDFHFEGPELDGRSL
ncbi:hypothetical protein ID866_8315 [Astraeus odoratus]|nr:hypothetical protein ID866_8315 [Astraeus odoratus]